MNISKTKQKIQHKQLHHPGTNAASTDFNKICVAEIPFLANVNKTRRYESFPLYDHAVSKGSKTGYAKS